LGTALPLLGSMVAVLGADPSEWSRPPVTDTGATESVAVLAFRVSPKPFAGLVNISEAFEVVEALDPERLRADVASVSRRSVVDDSRLDKRPVGSALIKWRQQSEI
jgi:hypothetical protein